MSWPAVTDFRRGILTTSEFACWGGVIQERHEKHGFFLSAWAFLPNHRQEICCLPYPLTISRVMESIKVWAMSGHSCDTLGAVVPVTDFPSIPWVVQP